MSILFSYTPVIFTLTMVTLDRMSSPPDGVLEPHGINSVWLT